MQFALLIYQGTTPLPNTDAWASLSKEEQRAIYSDYAALNETPGLEPGLPLGLPQDATTVRVENGSTVTCEGRTSTPKARSAATWSSRPTTSTRRSPSPHASQPPATAAPSRCAPSPSTRNRMTLTRGAAGEIRGWPSLRSRPARRLDRRVAPTQELPKKTRVAPVASA